MAVPRSLRRNNPATIIVAAILLIGFFLFFHSSSSGGVDTRSGSGSVTSGNRQKDAAANPLSPPTKPFKLSSDGKHGPPPIVRYFMNNMTASSNPIENRERVLILTPMSKFYPQYWENLNKLTFPHELISLGFILPKTREGNAATTALQAAVKQTQTGPVDQRFASVSILRQDFAPAIASQSEAERHKLEVQKERRKAMAQARNSLLFTTLGPSTSWVLWLDADIIETPPTLIQDLTKHDKPVLVPNCFQRYINPETKKPDTRPYDYNSWVDSDAALRLASEMGPDDILLEGYAEMPTYRTLMAHMADRSENADKHEVMKLDGLGGTALLVKADVHRDGAMFPPFPFYHLVETEGFAKMARRLGWDCWGLPNYFVSIQLQ
ncbi:MNN9 protein [Ascosphaera apis ARSEF 7405]|uniref:MNN9 protein n=1 Tax=Ascosphaera apis ARSEF 7405 TaxID=392613 RepID=A0A167VME5_9EURO|nr:MNN9 protein [Ascosphaera apis ARSEF 7405]